MQPFALLVGELLKYCPMCGKETLRVDIQDPWSRKCTTHGVLTLAGSAVEPNRGTSLTIEFYVVNDTVERD